MPITRSILFGALAALGIPNVFRYADGAVAEFIYRLSISFEVAGAHFRWSWTIFFGVTAITFLLLLIAKDR